MIVEVDGGYHAERHQHENDVIRQDWLEHLGYKVLRFSNDEVVFNIDKTLNIIKEQIN
ncbi:MAG: DUF559 domain-containing protein [Prevotellaceae bacterium]|nr:DUF559 domain-containing protein [Candidatus Minthosoma caballi]